MSENRLQQPSARPRPAQVPGYNPGYRVGDPNSNDPIEPGPSSDPRTDRRPDERRPGDDPDAGRGQTSGERR